MTSIVLYKAFICRTINHERILKWGLAINLNWPPATIENKYDFQQRMSRLLQRWRTQRNAILSVICKTSWIIKILNAHCASSSCWKHVSSSVHIPHSIFIIGFDAAGFEQKPSVKWTSWTVATQVMLRNRWRCLSANFISASLFVPLIKSGLSSERNLCGSRFWISNETRLPAEFKHIIKRWKRN